MQAPIDTLRRLTILDGLSFVGGTQQELRKYFRFRFPYFNFKANIFVR